MKLLLALALLAQQQQGDDKVPPPEEINKAIDRGVEVLLQSVDVDAGHPWLRCDELLLFALAHAGKMSDARARKLLDRVLKSDMNAAEHPTYNVSLRAMALAQIDPVKHQVAIAQCAWWLVNAQTDNGQWDYWSLKDKPPTSFPKIAWPGKQATGEKTESKMGLQVKRVAPWADRPPTINKVLRNTSTAQYATLGLYAAHRAKVIIPNEIWDRTLKSVLSGQNRGGGWAYIHHEDKGNDWIKEASGLGQVNRSMTASQLSVLAVLKAVLETPPRDIDSAMDRGFKWLAEDLILKRAGAMKGPTYKGADTTSVYWHYWLYSVERAGILWGRERIGDKWWYAQGANELLRLQNPDGSWGQDFGTCTDRPADTAFAVLFLKRAVPPPVATGGKEEK
ncbi:MAG TPA: hypothetical protein VFS19_07140 [Planctomycetota bacterium]|nr:hypothetical protein [Planctomycetota bacterium]